jgi:ubiquinone/menaquinone biosynthesis C-methylase UbiE
MEREIDTIAIIMAQSLRKKISQISLIKYLYMSAYRPLLFWWHNRYDRKCIATYKLKCNVPPASLRHSVQGNASPKDFLDVGKRTFQEIEIALQSMGKDVNSFENILDFGCGCGRTIIWFMEKEKEKEKKNKFNLYGTDIDSTAIKWCRENLDSVKFNVNGELPPLEYQDNFFDFIYALSVFTHLNEDYQFLWLKELKRILKPNGILIISLHGQKFSKDPTQNETRELQETGYSCKVNYNGKGNFPDWSRYASFHTKEYVSKNFGQYFKVLSYTEKTVNNLQDMVILQKMT